ncbi:hypothetical protein N9Y48_00225 [Zobellia sp.]|nr:hypothetical protein [Zobellia sp.]
MDISTEEGLKEYYSGFFSTKKQITGNTTNNGATMPMSTNFPITKTLNMTPERLRAENPSLYQTIFNQGVNQERTRVNGWLNSGTANKWKLRDGIKSGKSVNATSESEIDSFYGNIDKKLQGKESQSKAVQDEVLGNTAPDQYQKMEASEFYAEVDKMK